MIMNPSRMAILMLMLVGLVLGTAGSTSSTSSAASSEMFLGTLGVTVGAHIVPTANYGNEIGALNALVGKKHGIVMYFLDWSQDFGPYLLNQIRAQLPSSDWPVIMLTWEPQNGRQSLGCNQDYNPKIPLDSITSGVCDTYIRNYARALKARPERFLMRMGHEMNTTDYPWSGPNNGNDPSKYVNMYRHVRDIFTSEQATNVEWVWSPNYASNPPQAWNDIDNYYPGDAYVDWIGLSGYNWYSTPGHTAPWRTFSDIYDTVLRDLTCTYAKPQIIAEMGTIEGTSPTKADWIADAYQKIPNYPFLRGVVYFNNYAGQNPLGADFRVTTYTGSGNPSDPTRVNPLPTNTGVWTNAYKTAIANAAFVTTLPSRMAATPSSTYCGPIPPPNPVPSLTSPEFVLTYPGDQLHSTVIVRDITATVTLILNGLPANYSYSFNPPTIGPFTTFPQTGTVQMTINVPSNASLGNFLLTVKPASPDLPISDDTLMMVKDHLYFVRLPFVTRP